MLQTDEFFAFNIIGADNFSLKLTGNSKGTIIIENIQVDITWKSFSQATESLTENDQNEFGFIRFQIDQRVYIMEYSLLQRVRQWQQQMQNI